MTKKHAVAYYRTSIESPHFNPLAQQQSCVHEWARLHDVEIVGEFVDTDKSQPSLAEMKRWLEQRDDVRCILCWDLTRIGRSISQIADVESGGKQIVSVSTAGGEFFGHTGA